MDTDSKSAQESESLSIDLETVETIFRSAIALAFYQTHSTLQSTRHLGAEETKAEAVQLVSEALAELVHDRAKLRVLEKHGSIQAIQRERVRQHWLLARYLTPEERQTYRGG
jgi:hypothetical protein